MMILKEHNISVRLPQERAVDTGIVFVQNDKDVYKLNVRVFDGVYEIDYTEVEEATITFSKADGKVVQGDMQIEADQLTYVLGTNEIAAPGKLLASIQLLGANERLTTARFLFGVEKDLITPDTVKSTSEFPILQQLKQELEDIDVVELTNQFNTHKADNMTQKEVHGLRVERGIFTPTIIATVEPTTYGTRAGYYEKIGNHVTVRVVVVATTKSAGMSGNLVIGGLPFVSSNSAYKYASCSISEVAGLTYGTGKQLFAQIPNNSTYIRLLLSMESTGLFAVSASEISDGFYITLQCTYETD